MSDLTFIRSLTPLPDDQNYFGVKPRVSLKIPRLTIGRLMIVILVFAAGWWMLQTASRWKSSRLKAAHHATREEWARKTLDRWIRIEEKAGKLLNNARSTPRASDVEEVDEDIIKISGRYRCPFYHDVFAIEKLPEVEARDRWLREDLGLARTNRSYLEPLLAYHESLHHKYEYAMNHPWQSIPPDPPKPR